MELAFHFDHVDRYLLLPHSEYFKVCDNTLVKKKEKKKNGDTEKVKYKEYAGPMDVGRRDGRLPRA